MKKSLLIIPIILSLISCQEVIDVDLTNDVERLVVDALIRVNENQTSTNVIIKTSLSSSYFDSNIPITVESLILNNNETDTNIILSEQETGTYSNTLETDFLTQGELTLTIVYNNEVYSATTNYVQTVPFNSIEQGNSTLLEEDETEVVISYTDKPDEINYYLFDFDFNEYLVSEDEFYQGETFEFSYFYDSELSVGESATISILGVDSQFYNYISQLISLTGGNQGPFQAPTSTTRGNIVNRTTDNLEEDYPLGYFAICQIYSQTVTIE
ncbi:DUF4249 domain-containing protein [Cellulophaga baltica]|uniref:DUF4249 domain-containing protein n=1 Tax=Cellulophaga TaxID=104264 RepID=UPI001C06735D|nr:MULTISPECIES: DUF4249 domain-containing protein [Cellulophaga]MBU2996001.1 DUF4249 domain-containing protein [Cellulophaga baltica]MDO6767396.1 DUF4249 domain-containing protein [Cellulophaga sp. 1_MG-2023]